MYYQLIFMHKIDKIEGLGTYWWFEFFEEIGDFKKVQSRILKELEIFEKSYSRFLENSQISTLNSQRYLQNPSQELIKLIQIGLDFYHKTDGYFNPILGGVLEGLGYDKDYSFALKNQDKIIDGNFEKELFQQVSDPKDFVVFESGKISFAGRGNWDLGGYGKGFLIDKIGAILESEFGLKNFLINGGGDILVRGNLPQEIILEDPFNPGYELTKITLQNSALGASSTQKRTWKDTNSSQIFSHILNPKKMQTVANVASFVIAKNALEADVLATLACMSKDNSDLIPTLKNQFNFEHLVF
jgi:thiamine biosynthesis lipoprotein